MLPYSESALSPLWLNRHAVRLENANHEREPIMLDIVYIAPLVALIFGILILFIPRALNYLVAIYLILVGIMGLYPHFAHPMH
jgi:hypothetical protein